MKPIRFYINFDGDLDNPIYHLPSFDDLQSAIDYLDDKTEDELYELYLEWCDENGYLEDERLSKADFLDNVEITIREIRFFEPSINADKVLDGIAVEAYDYGGEFAEGYLENVKRDHKDELSELLNKTLYKWLEKYPQYKPDFYRVVSIHRYY